MLSFRTVQSLWPSARCAGSLPTIASGAPTHSRPAVICGTVDMIGSRLLFSGYGTGFKSKPLHAGFLGQDVLVIHDEAHLEPAFQTLLTSIEKEQERCKEFRKFRVMQLTATSRGGEKPFELTPLDFKNDMVIQRVEATKKLGLIANKDPKKLAEEIAGLALKFKHTNCAVLVFARTVDDVLKIREKLEKEKQQVEILTGTCAVRNAINWWKKRSSSDLCPKRKR